MKIDFNRSVLTQLCEYRNRYKHKNNIIIIVGELGTGKSFAGGTLCESMDQEFKDDPLIVWNLKEFFRTVKDKTKRYVLIDETNLQGYSSYEWNTIEARIFGFLAQSLRFRFINIVMTLPKFQMLSYQSRSLVNFIVKMHGVYGKHSFATVYKFKHDGLFRSYFKRIERLVIPKPSKSFITHYMKVRKEFILDKKWVEWEKRLDRKLKIPTPSIPQKEDNAFYDSRSFSN